MSLFPISNISMVFDIIGAVFASIITFLPNPPVPPPPPTDEDGTDGIAPELSFCQMVAMVALTLIEGHPYHQLRRHMWEFFFHWIRCEMDYSPHLILEAFERS